MPQASDIWKRIVHIAADLRRVALGGIGPKFRFGGKFIQPERPWSGVVDLDRIEEGLAADVMGFFAHHKDSLIVQRLALHEMWFNGDRTTVPQTALMASLLAGDRAADQREQVLVLVGCDMDNPLDREVPARALRKAHERLGGDGKRFHVRLFDARDVRMIGALDDMVHREAVQADLPPDHRGAAFFATHQAALAACIADLVGWRDENSIDREMMLIAGLPEWCDRSFAEGRPWAKALDAPLSERYARWVARPGGKAAIELLALYDGARVLATPGAPVEAPTIDPMFARMLEFVDDMLLPDETERIWHAFCKM